MSKLIYKKQQQFQSLPCISREDFWYRLSIPFTGQINTSPYIKATFYFNNISNFKWSLFILFLKVKANCSLKIRFTSFFKQNLHSKRLATLNSLRRGINLSICFLLALSHGPIHSRHPVKTVLVSTTPCKFLLGQLYIQSTNIYHVSPYARTVLTADRLV